MASAILERPVTDQMSSDRPGTGGSVVSARSQDPNPRGKARESMLGVSLNRTLGDRPKSSDSTVAGSTGRGSTMINPAVSKNIANRYASEVKASDRSRKQNYKSMEQVVEVKPDGIDVARDMRRDINAMMNTPLKTKGKTAIGGGGWDSLFTNQTFQKQMQFLHDHARTGHFTEQYGADGWYEGEFLHGMRHGKGKHEFRDEVYEGEWKWDQRHGWGSMRNPDGTVIKGEWTQGKPGGFASVIDQKGTVVYEGEFKGGKRHGLGRQLFESGDMYDGGWQEGRLHDRGVYYFTNGDKLYGMWNKGIYDGVGVFHYADGSISRRAYKDGLLMSVQDYEHASQRFGKTLTREGMQKHTRDRDFPKDVFLLNCL